ncbi:MAG: hypothetical protein ACI8X5_001706 [Planctomycetota bacterium]|jgi:hypothetical protein
MTSPDCSPNRLNAERASNSSRSGREVILIGSMLLMRKGSMMVFTGLLVGEWEDSKSNQDRGVLNWLFAELSYFHAAPGGSTPRPCC